MAGGEYPIPVSQDNGSITIEYKPFGVELNFTPRVIDNDVINLELSAAVSSIDSANGFTASGFSVDAFKRRETSTTVEMRDGESFAIAGLLQDDFMDLNGQVPWVGDIPILGSLFRSAEYSRKQTELVIIVTPAPCDADAWRSSGIANRSCTTAIGTRFVPLWPYHCR